MRRVLDSVQFMLFASYPQGYSHEPLPYMTIRLLSRNDPRWGEPRMSKLNEEKRDEIGSGEFVFPKH